jgi:hypothetical protein
LSVIRYILGLGDRHPSNLMLNRHTGKILHIDFGDCFEALDPTEPLALAHCFESSASGLSGGPLRAALGPEIRSLVVQRP